MTTLETSKIVKLFKIFLNYRKRENEYREQETIKLNKFGSVTGNLWHSKEVGDGISDFIEWLEKDNL